MRAELEANLSGMDTGAPSSSGDDVELLRAHEAAGLALVRAVRDGSTKWIAWPPRNSQHSREPSITLKKKDFARNAHFQVIASADGHAPQNVLILLHGRGDNEEPFARLGAQMALPQTGQCFCEPICPLDRCCASRHANAKWTLISSALNAVAARAFH